MVCESLKQSVMYYELKSSTKGDLHEISKNIQLFKE